MPEEHEIRRASGRDAAAIEDRISEDCPSPLTGSNDLRRSSTDMSSERTPVGERRGSITCRNRPDLPIARCHASPMLATPSSGTPARSVRGRASGFTDVRVSRAGFAALRSGRFREGAERSSVPTLSTRRGETMMLHSSWAGPASRSTPWKRSSTSVSPSPSTGRAFSAAADRFGVSGLRLAVRSGKIDVRSNPVTRPHKWICGTSFLLRPGICRSICHFSRLIRENAEMDITLIAEQRGRSAFASLDAAA